MVSSEILQYNKKKTQEPDMTPWKGDFKLKVFWCRVDSWLEDLPSFSALCEARHISLEQYLDRKDAVLHCTGRALLRFAWRKTFTPPFPGVGRTEQGKPYFLTEKKAYCSLSHSGALVLCALGRIPVGIDTEELLPVSEDLFHALHPEEVRYIRSFPAEEQDAAFYRIWTGKESLVKLEGSGLGALLEMESIVSDCGTLKQDLHGRHLQSLDICPEGYISVICMAREEEVETNTVSPAELEADMLPAEE